MQLTFKRNTGFYGMGSPLVITKNKKKWFSLNQNEYVTMETAEKTLEIQVIFYLLKSKPILIQENENVQHFEIKMNPRVKYSYLVLFLLMFLLPIVYQALLAIILLVLVFIGFMLSSLNQAYIIKEIDDGDKRGAIFKQL